MVTNKEIKKFLFPDECYANEGHEWGNKGRCLKCDLSKNEIAILKEPDLLDPFETMRILYKLKEMGYYWNLKPLTGSNYCMTMYSHNTISIQATLPEAVLEAVRALVEVEKETSADAKNT